MLQMCLRQEFVPNMVWQEPHLSAGMFLQHMLHLVSVDVDQLEGEMAEARRARDLARSAPADPGAVRMDPATEYLPLVEHF